MRVMRCVPPAAGSSPSCASGSPTRASSATTRRSHASASSNPPPSAAPLISATDASGLCSMRAYTCCRRRVNAIISRRPSSEAKRARMNCRSAPAQNTRCALRIHSTRTRASPSARSSARFNATIHASSIAFTGGRHSVATATVPSSDSPIGCCAGAAAPSECCAPALPVESWAMPFLP
jgi:hypothetical protein